MTDRNDAEVQREIARNQTMLAAAINNLVYYGVRGDELQDIIDAMVEDANETAAAAERRSAEFRSWELSASRYRDEAA